MLDKDSRTALAAIKYCDRTLSSKDLLTHMKQKWPLEKLDASIAYLESRGLVSCVMGDNSFYAVSLTYKGKHYGEFKWLEFKKFLFQSVLVPVFVSFVTSVLTILTSIALRKV